MADQGAAPEPMSDFSWDAANRWLEFRRNGPGFFQWYRLCLTYGVVAGRFSHGSTSARPPNTDFTSHVTGWSPTWLDSGDVPRAWNVIIDSNYHGVLRIDRDRGGALQGRLKMYRPGEELENDLTGIAWNGTNLSFRRTGPGFIQAYTGTASGRMVQGVFVHNGGPPAPWSGMRAEVLGFGLGSRQSQRAAWQEATRARIVNLTEGMRIANANIPAVTVTDLGPVPLPPALPNPFHRDDNPGAWPVTHRLRQLRFSVSPGSRFDPANPPPPRSFDGYLATPASPPPAGGYRAVVAVNGHDGGAQTVMTGSHDVHWYGDSFARRGFIVLAIDIGHRPRWGPGLTQHAPIIDAGYADSNWEEDGERSFSVRRAIDWLLNQPGVRSNALFMAGISLGGEVTTITGGLDPRIGMVIAGGFSPDMHVMDQNGNHPCYKWVHADIHEYISASDYEALTAPRPLVVQTGLEDRIFSNMTPPWASDKQVVSRAYAAYGSDEARLIHYLHYDAHRWHVGDINPTDPGRPRGVLASTVTRPIVPGDFSWQTNNTTVNRSPTLYTLMDELLP
jgi:dienelactone hydrolase